MEQTKCNQKGDHQSNQKRDHLCDQQFNQMMLDYLNNNQISDKLMFELRILMKSCVSKSGFYDLMHSLKDEYEGLIDECLVSLLAKHKRTPFDKVLKKYVYECFKYKVSDEGKKLYKNNLRVLPLDETTLGTNNLNSELPVETYELSDFLYRKLNKLEKKLLCSIYCDKINCCTTEPDKTANAAYQAKNRLKKILISLQKECNDYYSAESFAVFLNSELLIRFCEAVSKLHEEQKKD